ncbi:hypothetical protein CDL15_Pgr009463 [Punica granatum]|uniref:Uncharacterized protein n=1 Tax=Punica granatum TaxID=22663 RepID=A0A218WTI6_PUNGR|nr:hypothetical protein CDL15_Pgr009463 [Punica granatum]
MIDWIRPYTSSSFLLISSSCCCFFFFFIVSLIHQFHGQTVSLSNTFLLPVTKDASSLQYLAKIRPGGNSPRPFTLFLDLSGPELWTSHGAMKIKTRVS